MHSHGSRFLRDPHVGLHPTLAFASGSALSSAFLRRTYSLALGVVSLAAVCHTAHRETSLWVVAPRLALWPLALHLVVHLLAFEIPRWACCQQTGLLPSEPYRSLWDDESLHQLEETLLAPCLLPQILGGSPDLSGHPFGSLGSSSEFSLSGLVITLAGLYLPFLSLPFVNLWV